MKKIFQSFIFIVIIIFVGSFLWWINGTSAVNSTNTKEQTFVVAPGEGTKQIGFALKGAGLIKDSWAFFLLVKFFGYDGKIQAGSFFLSSSQTPQEIIQTMLKGTQDVWVTIPEGKRATEVAEILSSKLPKYSGSWVPTLVQQEGYLFPDTYLFPLDSTVNDVIVTMEHNFDRKFIALPANTTKLNKNAIVILASIVQREGKSDNDMKFIASVLENRLNLGMALQTDATIQYIKGNSFSWWPTVTTADLQILSNYNTYLNSGLPPTPISNPGIVALSAVANPLQTNYLYYFTDGKGITHFSQTLDEQNANIAKFGE